MIVGLRRVTVLLWPRVVADDLDQVGALVVGYEVAEYVCVDVAGGACRSVHVPVGEGIQDLILEVRTRVHRRYCLTLCLGE